MSSKRRLAAILAADVVDYTRLMGADQEGTLSALRDLRNQVFAPIVRSNDGTVVKSMGDGWILEFPAVTDAVAGAMAIQKALADHETIRLRMGIHTGEVVFEDEDIFGDGVNVAARLEALASPGAVLISDNAYQSLDGKTAAHFSGGKAHELKNVARPVGIWHWPEDKEPSAAALARNDVPDDKPSIAVLPFSNLSNDPEQDFFADGLTEDLITDLSKVSGLFVVARNSSFLFKGQNLESKEVGNRLGVRHLLEGRVRRAAQKVRVNVELIDAQSGGQIWADRYDGIVDDVFELQDRVAGEIISVLQVTLSPDEAARMAHIHTQNVDAYELFIKAKQTPYPPVPERIMAAFDMFQQVIKMDPKFAGGYSGASWMLSMLSLFGHKDPSEWISQAMVLAKQGLDVDPDYYWAHSALSLAYLMNRDYENAFVAADRAVSLQPNDADAHAYRGMNLFMAGRYAPAYTAIDEARHLSPEFVNAPYLNLKGMAACIEGDYEAAKEAFELNIARQGPVGPPVLAFLMTIYRHMGDEVQAARAADRLNTEFPGFRIGNWNFFRTIKNEADRHRILNDMEAAGVPV